jgi:hypothetical protein
MRTNRSKIGGALRFNYNMSSPGKKVREKKRGGILDTMCSELMPRVLTREYL